ncbi:MAG: lysophospholipid acyltransferase family protein [Oligoflexia bacterium]|nr:lysophospholipid acyltransferase family protein [Oligoflexia bacterium]
MLCCGSGLGAFLSLIGFRKKIVRTNLEMTLCKSKHSKRRSILEKSIYQHIGTLFIEILRNFSLNRSEILSAFEVSSRDVERLKRIIDENKGAIFISGHIGNWELIPMGISVRGFPVSIVVKKMNSAISQYLISHLRKRTGIGIIYSGKALEKMEAELSQGRFIGMMMDQNITGSKGIRANFLGVPASSIRGISHLVKKTGAKVFSVAIYRKKSGNYQFYLSEEIEYQKISDSNYSPVEKEAREEWVNTQIYQTEVEKLLRRKPSQWLWIHRRWKCSREPLVINQEHKENISL